MQFFISHEFEPIAYSRIFFFSYFFIFLQFSQIFHIIELRVHTIITKNKATIFYNFFYFTDMKVSLAQL